MMLKTIQIPDVDIVGICSVMYQPAQWDDHRKLGNSPSDNGKSWRFMQIWREGDISMTRQDMDNKAKLKWVLYSRLLDSTVLWPTCIVGGDHAMVQAPLNEDSGPIFE